MNKIVNNEISLDEMKYALKKQKEINTTSSLGQYLEHYKARISIEVEDNEEITAFSPKTRGKSPRR